MNEIGTRVLISVAAASELLLGAAVSRSLSGAAGHFTRMNLKYRKIEELIVSSHGEVR
jgi:hypothetical protein